MSDHQLPPPRAEFDASDWIITDDAWPEQPPPSDFIEGLVPDAQLTLLYGDSQTYKSFIALDWLLSSGHGHAWHGHDVDPGIGLFIAGEGGAGLKRRVDAWRQVRGISATSRGLIVARRPFDLLTWNEDQALALRDAVRSVGPVSTVAFDTLHSLAPGMEENSSQDVGTVYGNVKRLLRLLGEGLTTEPRALMVHHTGLAAKDRPRGSAAWINDVDNAFVVKKAGALSSTIKATKIKDDEAPGSLAVRFERHELAGQFKANGEPVTSLVSGWVGKPKAADPDAAGSKDGMEEAVLAFKAANPTATHAAIAEATGASTTSVGRYLRKAVAR